MPQLQYHTILKIDDSLEVIVRYIEAAVLFIANLFGVTSENKTKRGICPFQFDLCISSGASIEITKGAEIMDDKSRQTGYSVLELPRHPNPMCPKPGHGLLLKAVAAPEFISTSD